MMETIRSIFDEMGRFFHVDEDGKPKAGPVAPIERIANALESIAVSLEKLSTPTFIVDPNNQTRPIDVEWKAPNFIVKAD